MIYSILVLSSSHSRQSARSAALFAQAVIDRGHSLHRVFFMDEGVMAGVSHAVYPQDEVVPLDLWTTLAKEHSIDLVLCVSSALKRGLLDDAETKRHHKASATVDPAFTISGLGQLVDATANSDRLITFGG